MNYLKIVILLISILFGMTNAGNIIPDPQNPVLIYYPNIILQTSTLPSTARIDVRFTLDSNSAGIGYGQYMVLVFPPNISDLQFDQGTDVKYSCALTDGTTTYTMKAEKPLSSSESNFAYCKLDDLANNMIKGGTKFNYKFTLNLTSAKLTSNYIRSLKFFTSTSNKSNKMIIDQLSFLGNIALYSDASVLASKPIDITSSSILVGSSTETNIYPYQSFDIALNIKSNIFLAANDFVFTFKFNKDVVSAPQSAISNAITIGSTTDPLTGAIKGSLSISSFSTGDGVVLSGITEDLIPNRQFQIILKSWKAQDKMTNTQSPLEMMVYYKNTYSLISYVVASTNFFRISYATITLAASHPHGYDIFRNGVFPMKFSFTSNKDLTNGGFVLIQQSNTQDLISRFNFVAATCDFSENDNNFEQGFGKRPQCFPIRTDFNYTGTPSTGYAGSGIFFYMKSLTQNKTYYVTVWGSADACGGSTKASFQSYDTPNINNTFTAFAFQSTVYTTINPGNSNEARFTNSPIIAQSISTSMTHKCWNSMTQVMELDVPTYAPAAVPFTDHGNLLQKTNEIELPSGGALSTHDLQIKRDTNLYREFANFSLLHIIEKSGNSYLGAIGTAAGTPTESFIYGSSQITTQSYFTIKATFPVMPTRKIFEYVPSPIGYHTASTSYRYIPGRLELKVPRTWFTTGDAMVTTSGPGCYFSWGLSHQVFDGTSEAANGSEAVHLDTTATTICPNTAGENKLNFISSYYASGCTSTPKTMMDTNNSILPASGTTNTSLHLKILSLYHNGGDNTAANNKLGFVKLSSAPGNNYFAFPVGSVSGTVNISKVIAKTTLTTNLVLFSNCLKWNPPSAIKSLYTAIDIQLNWLWSGTDSSSTTGAPIRAIRFIKLFPEGGVFQDVNGNNSKVTLSINNDRDQLASGSDKRSFKLHFATGGLNTLVGVCLIEIWGQGLQDTSDSASPVLAIWIGFGVLLETDYNDLTANYPIAPLGNSSYNSYGLQSGYFMNAKENFYVHTNFFGTHLNSYNANYSTNAIDLTTTNKYPMRNLLIENSATFKDTYAAMTANFETTAWDLGTTIGNTTKRGIDTTVAFGENGYSSSVVKSYYRSNYLFFMGSLVLVTGITSNTITTTTNSIPNNLLIPIYCPIHENSGTAIKAINGLPTLYMAYLSMNGFNSITSVNRIYSHKVSSGIYTTIISSPNAYSSSAPVYAYYRNDFANADYSYHTTNYNNYLFTLRWAPYTSTITNNDNILYLYYYSANTTPTAATNPNCTGHSFLINSKIVTVDSSNLAKFNITGGEVSLFNGIKKFYYLGFEFNKFIGIGLSNGSNSTTNAGAATSSSIGIFSQTLLTQESSTTYLTGIKRPSVDSFYTNGVYSSPFNQIAYFCASAQAESKEMFGNYLFYPSSLSRSFIVDFNPPVTSPKAFVVTITQDKSETIFKSDVAGNTKIDVTLPAKIPGGFSLKFFASSNSFNTNTICGLVTTSTQPVVECTQETSTLMSCPLNRSDNRYVICCYNVSITTDTFSLSSLYAYAPAQPNPALTSNKFNTDIIYTANSQINPTNTLTWATSQSTGTDVIGGQNAKITKIDYQQVVQDSAIGKLILTITLPREPVRNSVITLVGDFSSMLIQNSSPRCQATFGGSLGAAWDNSGDILLDTCDVSNLSGSTSPIIVTTKNFVYKCGLSFSSKTLTIRLWPVVVIDWRNNPYSSNSYKVTMALNNSNNDAIAYNSPSFTIPNTLSYSVKPGFTGQWDSLCTVSSVIPKIPGEYADYTFDFDLDTNKGSIANATPNEVSIFFPYVHYGAVIDNILCFFNNSLLNCSFTDEGILNVRFTTVLPIGSGKKIQITITGIYNPSTEADIYFPCTVNKTDFSSGVRTNIITGSGKLAGGIPIPSTTIMGAIRFVNVMSVSDVNPRNVSTHTFRLTFDAASNLSVTPITISNTPQIIITFPTDYNLAWYNNVKATAVIDEYTNDTTNTITKSNSFNPASVTQSGNRITIVMNTASIIFTNTWRYWEVKLSNITGPIDATASTNVNATTGPYSAILTNSNFSSIYRTYTNLNNLATSNLSTSLDSLIQFNRGIEFKFDNTKWVLDVNTSGVLNKITLRPGRYLLSSFFFKPNTSAFIQPRNAVITLNDQIFKLADNSYAVTTASYQATSFYIGVPCGTAPGSYLINFSMNGENISTFFAPLAPVQVTVDTSTTGTVSFSVPASIPAGSSTIIYYSLSEPNVDVLNINWVTTDTNKNDSTAQITSAIIPVASIKAGTTYVNSNQYYSTFKITNTQATSNQVFKANSLNSCYSWSNSLITFTISGTQAIIPNQYDFTSSFKYYNADTDSTLGTKNAIKFVFTPPYSPIYVYCALVCYNRNYPSDDVIRSTLNNNANSDNLTRFYSAMFNSKTATDIIFDNLVRGQRYKLRCIISSTEGEVTLRTSASISIDQMSTSNGTSNQFVPSAPTKTQCVQYYFTSDPGQATKIAMVNYCQKLFSQNGWSSSGCIICTDSGKTYTPPGLSLPDNITCTSTTSKAKLRFLQTTSGSTSTTPNAPGVVNSTAVLSPTTAGSTVNPSYVNQSNPITYSICPVQHPVCPTDVSGNKLYADFFNQLIADTKSTALFNTNLGIVNVAVNNTLIVSDSVTPDLSKGFTVNIISLNANGLVQFSAVYTSALRCSWKIAETTSAPTSGDINLCTDTQWCGANFYVGTLIANTSTNINNLKAFTSGKSYGLYIACFNDIPYSTSISNVYTVSLSIPNSSTTNTNTTPTNTNTSNNTNNTNTSADFTLFSYAILIILAFLF